MQNQDFINEEDFTNHIRVIIKKYGENIESFKVEFDKLKILI